MANVQLAEAQKNISKNRTCAALKRVFPISAASGFLNLHALS